MNISEKEDLKEKILETIAVLEDQVFELKILTQPIAPDDALGRITRMDAINNKSVNEENLRRAKLKLSKLQLSLSKIGEADFGKCIQCRSDIRPARLMYLPESTKCVKCAS